LNKHGKISPETSSFIGTDSELVSGIAEINRLPFT